MTMKRQKRESAGEWLARQFEYSYCEECGGDAGHHDVALVMGNFFAQCKYPPTAETNWNPHPVVVAYREKAGNPVEVTEGGR